MNSRIALATPLLSSFVEIYRMPLSMTTRTAVLFAVAVGIAAVMAAAPPTNTPPDYVQMLFRHGHRGPITPSPRTQARWTSSGWQPQQLTSIGIEMHRAFGRLLREMYVLPPIASPAAVSPLAYLPSNYSYSSLYIRSTDVDRCLMSVESLISQMYPDTPIPIHTVPTSQEWLLQMIEHCPSYVAGADQVGVNYDVLLQSNYSALMSHIEAWTGFAADYFDPSTLLWNAYDNFQCGEYIGVVVDEPYLLANWSLFMNLTRASSAAAYGMNGLDDPRGTVGAPIVNEMLKNFAAQSSGGGGATRMSLYSAHDTTLIALWSGLGLLPTDTWMNTPDFAQSAIFELRRGSDDWYINLKVGHPVVNGTSAAGVSNWTYSVVDSPLNCPGPQMSCSLTAFKSYVLSLQQPNGCCMRSDIFYDYKCDNYTAPTTDMASLCQYYRQFCPAQSCDADQILKAAFDPSAQYCQSIVNNELSQDQRAQWLGIGGGIMAGVWIIGVIIYCCVCRRRSHSSSSTNGTYTSSPLIEQRP